MIPKHPKAQFFVKNGLFKHLKSFHELEGRVSNIEGDKLRGDAFEVFVEAYLATQRKYEVREIWPNEIIPCGLLERLGLTIKDNGVDGIYLTPSETYFAYQVKFRTGRPPITWRELSTFIGLADSPDIACRVLITNCSEMPKAIKYKRSFFCIRGLDLDYLEESDFIVINDWLEKSLVTYSRKIPLPHQKEALQALIPALEKNDRVTAIMACGTGKTLVALWVVEEFKAVNILVLLPSLALLRQVLHEWLRETKIPELTFLCVCSDPTVTGDTDAFHISQSDLDFLVTSESSAVHKFLKMPFHGVKIVFSTYQSSKVVAHGMGDDDYFDIAIFDEAHKTAGRDGRTFSYALNDNHLRIRKRLFLTATPRHYNPHANNIHDERKLVYSMDKREVYGPQAFKLSFAEAAERGIICKYKIIISVITSKTVNNEILKRGEVLIKDDVVRAKQVANQIALRDVIQNYPVKKIFTFHKNVDSAASFASKKSEGVATHLPDFDIFHVNGHMTTAKREKIINDFKRSQKALISNARCLTEGVDVPAVDLVAFLSPKRSRVDIVQATGRAMRRTQNKDTGYVLVPLFLEQEEGEGIDHAVGRSDFYEIWDVINSLQEQDHVLAESFCNLGISRGAGKGFDDTLIKERLIFTGPIIELEELGQVVKARCLEKAIDGWNVYYGKLISYKERFGHCNVLLDWDEDSSLGVWVSNQRTKYIKGTLSNERIKRLEEIGFVWDYQSLKKEQTWMIWYQKLESFKKIHGHCQVLKRDTKNQKLASWVWIQRQRKRGTYKDKLSDNQIKMLESLGFIWDFSDSWNGFIRQLLEFKSRYGRLPTKHDGGVGKKLHRWISKQRHAFKNNKLENAKKRELDKIGVIWDPSTEFSNTQWTAMFNAYQEFIAEHKHTTIPTKYSSLRRWVTTQRLYREKGILSKERISRLDKIGFKWRLRKRALWDVMYNELVDFKNKHGHCNVVEGISNNVSSNLLKFVKRMRIMNKLCKLTEHRKKLLNDIGFNWSTGYVKTDNWNIRYHELIQHVKKTGGFAGLKKRTLLGNWVSQQRQNKFKGVLDPKREKLLNDINFIWNSNTDKWTMRYRQLLEYIIIHGHCKVPLRCGDMPGLGGWAARQRTLISAGKLSVERMRLLSDIRFN